MVVLALLVHGALGISIAPVRAARGVRRVQGLAASSQACLVHIAVSVSAAAPRAGNAEASSAFLGSATVIVDVASLLPGSRSSTRFEANASNAGLVQVANVRGIGVRRVGVVVGVAVTHRGSTITVVVRGIPSRAVSG